MTDDKQRTLTITRITWVGAVVDFLLAIIKVIVGYLAHSHALVADGIHSFSDLFSDALILIIARQAHSAPDAEHPYGHERFETLATLTLAVILVITGIWVIIDGFSVLYTTPQVLTITGWLLAVIILSIFSKEALYWYTRFYGTKIQSKLLNANAWHHRSDAISSVIVLIGVVGTLLGFAFLDAIAAVILGMMIIYIAYQLATPCVKELLDSAIDPELSNALKNKILELEDVLDIHDFRTRRNGRRIIIDLHIQVSPKLTVSEGHMVTISVENITQDFFENAADIIVHIDPENDQYEKRYQNIPSRTKIIRLFKQYLANEQCLSGLLSIQLHYLNGKVLIDAYFADNPELEQSKQTLIPKLNQFKQEYPFCSEINIYSKL